MNVRKKIKLIRDIGPDDSMHILCFMDVRYLSSIYILTTSRDQTHAPCASPKTHLLHISQPHYIADN